MAQNKVNKECNELINTGNRMQRELDSQTANCQHLASENQARSAELKANHTALTAAKLENGKLQRTVESCNSKLKILEEKLSSLEQNRDVMKWVRHLLLRCSKSYCKNRLVHKMHKLGPVRLIHNAESLICKNCNCNSIVFVLLQLAWMVKRDLGHSLYHMFYAKSIP